MTYLTKPNLPPSNVLNEPIEIILNVFPSLVAWDEIGHPRLTIGDNGTHTCRSVTREEWQDMCIDSIQCSQHIRRTVVFLKPVRHFADGHRNLEVRRSDFGGLNLLRQLCRIQGPIVQRFRAELQNPGDELGFRIGFQRLEEIVTTGLPDVWIVPAEPYQCVYSEAVLPSGVDNIIADRMSSTE